MRIRQKEIRRSRKRLEDRVKAEIKQLRKKPVAAAPAPPKPRTRRKAATPVAPEVQPAATTE